MKRADEFEKTLYQHAGLFRASDAQLKTSRQRIRERLDELDTSAEVSSTPQAAAKTSHVWRIGIAVAAASVLLVLITTVRADVAGAILRSFTKGMGETSGQLTPNQTPAGGRGAEFEVASIRQCNQDSLPSAPPGARGGGAGSFRMTPGRTYVLCMTLATIIRTAYGYGPVALEFLNPSIRGIGPRGEGLALENVYGLGVEDGSRVRNGPSWIRDERYTIEASAGTPADAATMSGPMLRALLESRFKLKAHIDTEQVPAFDLVIAKGGLKIKPNGPDGCEPTPPGTGPRPHTSADEVRRGAKATCGFFAEPHGPNTVFIMGGDELDVLARFLGGPLGMRVIDKTGSTDKFNAALEFVIDENTPGRHFVATSQEAASTVPPAATIFKALEEQLGLKLVASKTPREFIVIDHVERPTPNPPSSSAHVVRGFGEASLARAQGAER